MTAHDYPDYPFTPKRLEVRPGLTMSYLDEGPTWSPNGRVIMFTRQSPGASGSAQLFSVDISGRALKQVQTEGAASDPTWSPLLP